MTRVMREERLVGKEGCEMVSLKGLCGSGVIRQIVTLGDWLIECGSGIFPGFNRFLSMMCFFVVRMSQSGSVFVDVASSELSSLDASRFWVEEVASLLLAKVLIWLRRAEEALSV